MTKLRILTSGSLLALFLGLLSPFLAAQDDAESSLQAARKSIRAARGLEEAERDSAYDDALKLLDSIGSRWPDAIKERAAAAIEKGKLLQKLERPDDALESFRSVLDIAAPSSVQASALLAAASLQRRQDDDEAAKATLIELIERCPHDEKFCAEARLDLAGMARDAKHWATAIKMAEEVLEKHPGLWRQNVDACQLSIGVLIRCRQWDQARAELKRLDALLISRFKDQKVWASVERGMAKMSVRKSLTPIPVADPS